MKHPLLLFMLVFISSTICAQFDTIIDKMDGQLLFLNQPPASVELNELVSDTLMYVFIEKTDHILTDDIVVDLSQSGEYFPDSIPDEEQTWEDLVPTTIPGGTKVHSVYFHYDNDTYDDDFNVSNYLNCIGQYQVNGQVTFKYPILGIIMRASGNQPNLLNSDPELGVVGVDYCEHNLRHFPGINIVDGCQSDRFILSADRKTLTVRNNTDIHHDNYRVVLDASEITAVSERDFSEKIDYYPNPTNDHVRFEVVNNFEYTLINSKGQLLGSGVLTPGIQTVSLIGYPDGIYFIVLHKQETKKIIKVVKF